MLTPEELLEKYKGVKYKDKGRDPNTGLDCWGLCLCIAKDLYEITNLPDPHYRMLTLLRHKINLIKEQDLDYWVEPVEGELEYGDFVLINVVGVTIHGGVYIEDNKFIHAVAGKGMLLHDLNDWKKQVEGIYRLKEKHKNQT